jgi:hypothetical protein
MEILKFAKCSGELRNLVSGKVYNNRMIFRRNWHIKKERRTLICGSHRPLHEVPKVKSSVTDVKTGFKYLTLKHLSECITGNRQPTGKRETNKNGRQLPPKANQRSIAV